MYCCLAAVVHDGIFIFYIRHLSRSCQLQAIIHRVPQKAKPPNFGSSFFKS